jgi:hypothetical protein
MLFAPSTKIGSRAATVKNRRKCAFFIKKKSFETFYLHFDGLLNTN